MTRSGYTTTAYCLRSLSFSSRPYYHNVTTLFIQRQSGNNEVNNTPVQWVSLFHMLFFPPPTGYCVKTTLLSFCTQGECEWHHRPPLISFGFRHKQAAAKLLNTLTVQQNCSLFQWYVEYNEEFLLHGFYMKFFNHRALIVKIWADTCKSSQQFIVTYACINPVSIQDHILSLLFLYFI